MQKLRKLIAAKYGVTEEIRAEMEGQSNVTTRGNSKMQADDFALTEFPVTSFITTAQTMRLDSCQAVEPTSTNARAELDEVENQFYLPCY